MITIIDNYDSFTYNLVQYIRELGEEIRVVRNDQITVEDLLENPTEKIIISPGPGGPDDAGISKDVIRRLGPHIPILGVCLGHQCIGEAFGGRIGQAARLMHGKVSQVYHRGDFLFQGVPSPFEATRYHSLLVMKPLPPELKVTAFTREGEVMGLRHREYPIHGVQFHPESILTPAGRKILSNFLAVRQPETQHLERNALSG